MIEFVPLDWFKVGVLDAVVTENPHKCRDFTHLHEQVVRIGDQTRKIRNVEFFVHAPPWHAGERISLWLEPKSEGTT